MAVAIDATSFPHVASNVTSISWTHTPVGTPSAVGITTFGFATNVADTATCTYGGVTAPPATNGSDATGPDIGYIFGLANPPAGAQTVVITFQHANYPVATSITVTGSDTGTCFDNTATPVTGANTPTTVAVTCTSATGDLVLTMFGNDPKGTALTDQGAQTDYMTAAANGGEQCSASTQAGAASVTAQYGISSGGYIGLAASFKVATSSVALTATLLAAAADAFDTPAFTAFTSIWINTWVLDNGLTGLVNNADKIYICSAQPADFTGATVTFGLGNFAFGVGSVFGAPANAAPNGRVVTSNTVSSGSITANGTATYWAVVDSVNSRLLATGLLSGSGAVTSGNKFTLSAVSVHIPSQ